MTAPNITEVIARLRKKALHQLDFGRGRHVQVLANDVLDVLSHIEGLERDARRYRFLRDSPAWMNDYELRMTIQLQRNGLWDESIDAALAEQGETR